MPPVSLIELGTPEGQWKAALASRFDRSMHVFSVETTAADDATIITAFNTAPNTSKFNSFYQNCSDQARIVQGFHIGERRGSQILAGDQRVAMLVLDAVIDHSLNQSAARRDDIEYVNGLTRLFRQAGDTIGARIVRGAPYGEIESVPPVFRP